MLVFSSCNQNEKQKSIADSIVNKSIDLFGGKIDSCTIIFDFREAYNERTVNRIRFVDYNNYYSKVKYIFLIDMDKLFETGKLKLLSTIELKHINEE